MAIVDWSCAKFVDETFSKAPAPGGGGVAAIVGALGTALAGMVGNLTTGKKKYAAYEGDIQRILAEAEAMKNAKRAVKEVGEDFARTFGRKYGFFEEYRMEDAELALVLIGSTAGTAKACVEQLRAKGVKAGLVKLRVFRPFPMEEIAKALSGVKAVAVMDKSEGYSAAGGPLFAEVRSACYDLPNRPLMTDVVFGLAGRDCAVEDIERVYRHLEEMVRTGKPGPLYIHMGQRSSAEEVL